MLGKLLRKIFEGGEETAKTCAARSSPRLIALCFRLLIDFIDPSWHMSNVNPLDVDILFIGLGLSPTNLTHVSLVRTCLNYQVPKKHES